MYIEREHGILVEYFSTNIPTTRTSSFYVDIGFFSYTNEEKEMRITYMAGHGLKKYIKCPRMYMYHGILQSYMFKYEMGVIIGIEGCDTNEGNRIYTCSY